MDSSQIGMHYAQGHQYKKKTSPIRLVFSSFHFKNGGGLKAYPAAISLDVQILYIQRIVFNELAACFHILAHQRGEDGFRLRNILELH